MNAPPDREQWVRLGELIKLRMATRSLHPNDIEEAGGPKPTKLREIVNGRAQTIRQSLKVNLEKVLDWTPGSIDLVLAGGDPIARLTAADLRRDPGPLTVEEAEREAFIEEVLAGSDLRRTDVEQRRFRDRRLAAVRDARKTPPADRSLEQWELIGANEQRGVRADRYINDEPLIELVIDGQDLAAAKGDREVSAYVRQVESAVVGIIGVERLTEALNGYVMERDIGRAFRGGVLPALIDEVDRLRAEGLKGGDLMRRVSNWLDARLSQAETRQERIDTGSATPTADNWSDFEPAAARDVGHQSEGRRLREEQDRAAEDVDGA